MGDLAVLQSYEFEGSEIRVHDRNGEPWFVLTDVCRGLQLANPSSVASRLEGDEKDALRITDPMGREQSTTIITEGALYRLSSTSRKPDAKRWFRHVTDVVLVSIRKTGSYSDPRAVVPASNVTLVSSEQLALQLQAVATIIGGEIKEIKGTVNAHEIRIAALESGNVVEFRAVTDELAKIGEVISKIAPRRVDFSPWLEDAAIAYCVTHNDRKCPISGVEIIDKERRRLGNCHFHHIYGAAKADERSIFICSLKVNNMLRMKAYFNQYNKTVLTWNRDFWLWLCNSGSEYADPARISRNNESAREGNKKKYGVTPYSFQQKAFKF